MVFALTVYFLTVQQRARPLGEGGAGLAVGWGQVGGEFFRKWGYGRGRKSVAALGREWGNVASTVCADEEAMLGGNVDERYGTKTRQ